MRFTLVDQLEGNKAPNQGESEYCTVEDLYRDLCGVSLPTTPWGGVDMYRGYKTEFM